jgi:hypothetical protein
MPISKKRTKTKRIQKAVRKMIEGKTEVKRFEILNYWMTRPRVEQGKSKNK